jgi:hypothetical protein
MTMIPHDTHLHIGSLLFDGIDQALGVISPLALFWRDPRQ